MTSETVDTAPEQPPAPIPCAKCGSTDHTTGNHNGGTPAESTPDGNHNGGRPV